MDKLGKKWITGSSSSVQFEVWQVRGRGGEARSVRSVACVIVVEVAVGCHSWIIFSVPSRQHPSGAPATTSRLSEHCLLFFLIWAGQNVCCMYHITGRLGFLGLASLIGQTLPRRLLATNGSSILQKPDTLWPGRTHQPITNMMPLYLLLSYQYCFKHDWWGAMM